MAHPPSAFRTEIAPDDPMRSGHTAMKINWDFWWIHRYKALIALELSGRFGFFHRTGSPAFGIPVKRQPLPGPGPESHATVVLWIQSIRWSPGGIAPDGTLWRGLFPCAVGPASGLWRYQSLISLRNDSWKETIPTKTGVVTRLWTSRSRRWGPPPGRDNARRGYGPCAVLIGALRVPIAPGPSHGPTRIGPEAGGGLPGAQRECGGGA